MNIKEYISSGILESYVLGELTSHEKAEVENNLSLYPELREELNNLEDLQEQFLMASVIHPRAEVKKKIMNKVNREAKVVSINFWQLAAAASVTLALIATFLAYNYRSKWKSSENQLSSLIAQNQQIASTYNQVNDRVNRMENDLKVMDNPEFTRIIMRSKTKADPQAMASVYWNQSSNEVYLRIQNLKELSKESQYQLWAIVDGKPVDAGVFDGNVAGLHRMKNISKGAAAFAVTIEPKGGRTTPTMETMQVLGNVNKS